MKGALVAGVFLAYAILGAVVEPSIGVIAYCGYVVLNPEWAFMEYWPVSISVQKVLFGATIVGCILNGWVGQRLAPAGRAAVIAILGYGALALASCFQSLHPDKSWWYMDYCWKALLVTVVGCHMLDDPRKILAAMWTIVLAQGFNAFEVNLEYFTQGVSWTKENGRNFLDNNTYALSTLPPMALSAALAICSKPLWQRCLAGAVFLMQVHQIQMLETRGGMLSMLVLIALGVWFMPKRFDTVAGALAAALIAGVLAGPSVVKRFQTIFVEESRRDDSAASRFELWNAGFRIMTDYPMLGVGAFAGERLVPRYAGYRNMKEKALHNLFLDVGAGSGVPALALYLLFFAVPWFALWRIRRTRKLPRWATCAALGVLCGVPAYWVGSTFSSSGLIESPFLVTMIGVATLSTIARQETEFGVILPDPDEEYVYRDL